MRLFVGNLAFGVTDEDLKKHFSLHGFTPTDLKVMLDRDTGRSRGFAFVSFSDEKNAQSALSKMNGSVLGGRDLRISVAHDKNTAKPQTPTKHKTESNVARTTSLPVQEQKTYKATPVFVDNEPPRNKKAKHSKANYEKYASAYDDEWGYHKGGDRRRKDRRPKNKHYEEFDEDYD